MTISLESAAFKVLQLFFWRLLWLRELFPKHSSLAFYWLEHLQAYQQLTNLQPTCHTKRAVNLEKLLAFFQFQLSRSIKPDLNFPWSPYMTALSLFFYLNKRLEEILYSHSFHLWSKIWYLSITLCIYICRLFSFQYYITIFCILSKTECMSI